MAQPIFPDLSLANWQPTRDTIKKYAQIVGKIRRALTPKQKHWWHVSLRVAAAGLTTTPIPAGDVTFELIMDFTTHKLLLITSRGDRREIPFQGQSTAAFCTELLDTLAELEIKPDIDKSQFQDETAGTYSETAVTNAWQALSQIDAVLKEFRSSFRGESSPVQLWPHHFDLAVVWFSGRLVPDQDPDDEEYADEQMNFGFSTGDGTIAEPYFYATAYPTPNAFTLQPLPTDAYWHTEGFTAAILPYEKLTTANRPQEKLLHFLKTTHQAGAQFMQ